LGSLYQQEYEFEVNKTEELKQRLVELWKSSNTTYLIEKDAIFVFPCTVLPGIAEAVVTGEVKK